MTTDTTTVADPRAVRHERLIRGRRRLYDLAGAAEPTEWPSRTPITPDTDLAVVAAAIDSEQDVYLGRLGITADDTDRAAAADLAAHRVRQRLRRARPVTALTVAAITRGAVRSVHRVTAPLVVAATAAVTVLLLVLLLSARSDVTSGRVWEPTSTDHRPEHLAALRGGVAWTMHSIEWAAAVFAVIGAVVVVGGAVMRARRARTDGHRVVAGQLLWTATRLLNGVVCAMGVYACALVVVLLTGGAVFYHLAR